MSKNYCVACRCLDDVPEDGQLCWACQQKKERGSIFVDDIQGFGALFSKKDVRDYKIASAAASYQFPKEFELKMPRVKNQGSVGSCVAHSISTVIEYFNNLQQGNDEEMSVGYIYGNRTNTTYTNHGMYVREAVAVTCKYGDVTKNLFPYNEEVPGIIDKFNSASEELFEKGYPNRFTSYYRLYTEDEIKTSLMNNGPVVFAIPWYEDIKIVDGAITTKQEKSSSGHCMVIYGWDERGWKIQNSWGKVWANGGRAILPYDIKIREAWGIVDTFTNPDIDIVKPYNSQLGKLVAKILNLFISIGYKLIDIFKK